MKATCPNCSTSYRVADDKVPDAGAQIKCPKCDTTFIVHPEKPKETLPPPPKPAGTAGESRPPAPSASGTAGETRPPPPAPSASGTAGETPAAAPAAAGDAPEAAPAAGSGDGDPFPDSGDKPEQADGASPHTESTPLQDLMGSSTTTPPAEADWADKVPAEGDQGQVQPDSSAQPEMPVSSSATPNLDALNGEAEIVSSSKPVRASDETRRSARGVSAIRAQSTNKSASLEGFRVRTGRGLTYDFPTTEAMERWLSERDDLEGVEVCEPGGEWQGAEQALKEIAERPEKKELSAADPSKPIEVVAGPQVAELGDMEESSLPKKPPRAPRAGRAGPVLWVAVVLMLLITVVAGAVTVTRYGVHDLSPYLPLEQLGLDSLAFPEEGTTVAIDDGPVLPEDGDPEARFRRTLNAGRRSLRAKRFSRAALEYSRALSIHQGSVEALDGLAKSFAGLGDMERARDVASRANELRH